MRFSASVVLGLSLCFFAAAQQVSPDLFNGLKWRLIGPFRGGRAIAVSGVSGGGTEFLFGSVNGGIWKTTDAGSVWTPIFDDQKMGSIGALEVAPSDPNVIYAGTGESDIRSDLASGDGVYKSIDGGKTWSNIGLLDSRQISRIAIDLHDPNRVFVAALGHVYAPNEERGVFLTQDGGRTWSKILYKGSDVGAADVALSSDNPKLVFAAMWQAHRPPWSTYAPIGGAGSGLYRSRDGGSTWQQITGHGFPETGVGRIGIAIARGTRGSRVYAIVESSASDKAGLYRSDNGGDSWTQVNSDIRLTSRGWYFNCITVDPNDPDTVYDPNVALYKLTEGGKTLTVLRGAPGGDDYHQLWIDSANSKHMALASDQGTTVTLNGGITWSTWYNQPTAQFYHVTTDNSFPYHVYGSQQDSGTAATPVWTDHNQIDLRDWFTVGSEESGYVAPDPKDPEIFYVTDTFGEVARFDRRMMQSQNIAPWPMPGFGSEPAERKYRDPWTPMLVFSQADRTSLYLGTQYVMKTVDGGLHWQKISPDLTGAGPQHPANSSQEHPSPPTVADAKMRGYGVVYSIAPSPLNAAQIWAGSDSGLVHLTRNGGGTWSDVTPPGLSDWSKITQIEASHFNSGEAYVAVDRHRLDDRRPYLYRTRDFGKTWQAITTGISEPAFLNSVREDPKRKGLLFAGTELGVYVSFDDGDHWIALQLNLPVTSIRDLAIHDDDLIAATHGRAFWVLDNIASLREIGPGMATTQDHFFKPATAIRMQSDSFPGTPLPLDEPQAANPPRGAYIDYFVSNAAPEVTLEILDPAGKSIRRFSSSDKPPAITHPPVAPRWLPRPKILSSEPGMHRFVWDLRYARSADNPAGDSDADTGETIAGPLVLPGRYIARLTIGSHALTQPVEVRMDPRCRASAADLALRFHSSVRAFEDLVEARTAITQLHGLQARLDEYSDHASHNAVLKNSIAGVNKRAGEILSGEKSARETGLQNAARGLASALNVFESADRTPPSQALELYRETAAKLRARLADWQSLQQGPLADLNRQLARAHLEAIRIPDSAK